MVSDPGTSNKTEDPEPVLILLWSGYGLWLEQEDEAEVEPERLNPTLIWIWSLT